jgi:hypothetical protein
MHLVDLLGTAITTGTLAGHTQENIHGSYPEEC